MFLLWVPALIIALSIHEYAHARAAHELGDPTPQLEGRLTLNPLAHLDPLGTLALFFFHFGWGKPVRIDPFNFRHPRRDQAIVALAGPGSNLIFALLAALVFWVLSGFWPSLNGSFLYLLAYTIIRLNIGLGLFNLLPFGPLDGEKILTGFLSEDVASEWSETLSRYGWVLLLIFFLPLPGNQGGSLLDLTLTPVADFLMKLLLPGFPLV